MNVPKGYKACYAPMDSGCTVHTMQTPDAFISMRASRTVLRVADNQPHTPKFEGAARICAIDSKNNLVNITLGRALHTPKVTTLFSANAFIDHDHEVHLRRNHPFLKLSCGKKIPLVRIDKMFYLI